MNSSFQMAKGLKPLEPYQFKNKQLSLFQDFFANTDEQRNDASNSIELWDSVPRYSISRLAMSKLRDANGYLGILEIPFHYQSGQYKAVIYPALIKEMKGGQEVTNAYYPSANEELIEEALRKIAAIQNYGFHESSKRSGVVFTLYQLREELKQRGHTRSYPEVVQSINILNMSSIELVSEKNTQRKPFARTTYFPKIAGVSQADYSENPDSKWYVEFHPLVTESLDKLTYRQFNYQKIMSHTTQLARWIHKQLILKYTFASKMKPFEMRYSTIKRDSAMLNNYALDRQAIKACDFSMDELEVQSVAHQISKETVTGLHGKIVDVIYTITPTLDFIREVKSANARQGRVRLVKNL